MSQEEAISYFSNLIIGKNLNNLKKNYIYDFVGHGSYYGITKIDEQNGIVEYWGFYYDEKIGDYTEKSESINFFEHFEKIMLDEKSKLIKRLNENIEKITLQGNSPKEYIKLQFDNISKLHSRSLNIYKNYPVISDTVAIVIKHLKNRYGAYLDSETTKLSKHQNLTTCNSFMWDSINDQNRDNNLKKLFLLMTSKQNPIIECSESDFINAFSGKPVSETGIRWLSISRRNKKYNKSLLLYFVEKLNSEGYIYPVPSPKLNSKIEYVFRDNFGNKIEYIRQSKSNKTDKPTDSESIDSILDRLFQNP